MKQSVLSNRFAAKSESVPYGCLLELLSAWVVGIILNLNLVTKILGRWKKWECKGNLCNIAVTTQGFSEILLFLSYLVTWFTAKD